jgi:hypothetical protein
MHGVWMYVHRKRWMPTVGNPVRSGARVSRARRLAATVLLAIGVGSAGCGGGADAASVRAVSERFSAAIEAKDGQRACEQLSPQTRAQLEKQEQRQCREAITGVRLEPGSVTRVQVYVLNAMVELSNGDAEFLEEGQEGWRLSAAGCTPQKGKPRDHPYDCQVED